MSKSKRKIPTFRVSVMPDADYSQILHIPEVKEAVMDEVVIAIKEGVSTKKKSISLFSEKEIYFIKKPPLLRRFCKKVESIMGKYPIPCKKHPLC
jgi:hypothetical protein